MMRRLTLLFLFMVAVSSLFAQRGVRMAVKKGNNAYEKHQYSKAGEAYQKALEENVASKEGLFNLANAYYKQEQWDESLKKYEEYLALEKEDADNVGGAWKNIGNTYLKKHLAPKQAEQAEEKGKEKDNSLQASLEAYKNALRANPQDNESRENLAIVQKMIKDQEDGGGGKQEKPEEKQDDQQQKEEQKQEQEKDDKPQDGQMSQDNIDQILQSLEQQEKETQDRVSKAKSEERKQKNEHNKKHNKDW